jgi:serine kinase of HPr protein (carbohydrate metabolism regulator)
MAEPSIHASAVLVGSRAVLIRGPSGAGKSQLALALIHSAESGLVGFARLVADDRALLDVHSGRLIVRPPAALAGLIEVRGAGIRRMAYEPAAVIGLVVDLGAADAERVPPAGGHTTIAGVSVPRLAVAPEQPPLLAVLAVLTSEPARSAHG